MVTLPERTLAAIGRMTVAATDLEHLLAWIGADRAGGDAADVFGAPGEALIAARGAVELAAPEVRADLVAAVEAAGTRLALARTALRRLWLDDEAGDPAVFDDVARELCRCRDWLAGYVAEYLKA
jgi:hypothetical protein